MHRYLRLSLLLFYISDGATVGSDQSRYNHGRGMYSLGVQLAHQEIFVSH